MFLLYGGLTTYIIVFSFLKCYTIIHCIFLYSWMPSPRGALRQKDLPYTWWLFPRSNCPLNSWLRYKGVPPLVWIWDNCEKLSPCQSSTWVNWRLYCDSMTENISFPRTIPTKLPVGNAWLGVCLLGNPQPWICSSPEVLFSAEECPIMWPYSNLFTHQPLMKI